MAGKSDFYLLREVQLLRADLDDAEREIAELRQQIAGHCDRIAAQSELLSKRAEKS
jgi:peptidoglycan hydrolase CwlO-like protein